MTLADFRGIKKPEDQDESDPAVADVQAGQLHESAHPSPLEYVKIGLALAVVTAIEVAIFYMDVPRQAFIAILVVLSTLKFVLVVMWFMHLKFDNRLFSVLFTGGLILAVALFIVVLATLGGGIV
jgi:cytochrome c oxidase subunit 4